MMKNKIVKMQPSTFENEFNKILNARYSVFPNKDAFENDPDCFGITSEEYQDYQTLEEKRKIRLKSTTA